MIPYMVGKLAPNSTHSIRGLVKYVLDRGHFRAVPSQNGDTFVTSPPPIVERDHNKEKADGISMLGIKGGLRRSRGGGRGGVYLFVLSSYGYAK